jgi:hypothetical protein
VAFGGIRRGRDRRGCLRRPRRCPDRCWSLVAGRAGLACPLMVMEESLPARSSTPVRTAAQRAGDIMASCGVPAIRRWAPGLDNGVLIPRDGVRRFWASFSQPPARSGPAAMRVASPFPIPRASPTPVGCSPSDHGSPRTFGDARRSPRFPLGRTRPRRRQPASCGRGHVPRLASCPGPSAWDHGSAMRRSPECIRALIVSAGTPRSSATSE